MAKQITIEKTDTTFFLPARDLLAVWNAVSNEETRPYLKGVFVEQNEKDGVCMVATTGHILLRATLAPMAFMGAKVSTQATSHDRGFILTLDTADKALKSKALGEVWLYGDTETGIIQAVDVVDAKKSSHARIGVVEFDRIEGTFPDWRRIMPTVAPGSEGVAVSVNLALLDDFRKAAALYADRRDTLPVRITSGASGDPMRVEFKHAAHLTGVIMPMRF